MFPQLLKAERAVAAELVASAFQLRDERDSIEDVAFMSPWLEEDLTRQALELVARLPAGTRAIIRSPPQDLIRLAIRDQRFEARLAWLERLGIESGSEALLGLSTHDFADIADMEMLVEAKRDAIRGGAAGE